MADGKSSGPSNQLPTKSVRMEEPSRYICGEAAIAYIFSANEGQGRGVVLALAAYGASHSEIAAALDVPTSALSEIDRYHMQLGSGAAQGRLLDLLWKKAEGGNASVMMWLM